MSAIAPSAGRTEQVFVEQVRLLYASTPILTHAQLIGIGLFVYAFLDHAHHWVLSGWAGYQLLAALVRYDLFIRFRRAAPRLSEVQGWSRWFAMATYAIALGWGLTPLLFHHGEILRAFNMLVIAFLTAGALSSLSVSPSLYRGFLLLGAAPITLLYLSGEAGAERAIGIAATGGVIYLWRAAGHHDRVVSRSLQLRFENEALAAAGRASAGAFRSLFDAAPVPLMLVRRGDGQVTRFNSEALMMAIAPGANPGGWYELQSLADASAWREFADTVRRVGDRAPQAISFIDQNGVSRHFIVSSTPVEMDGEGFAIVGFQDVTDLKRYETELLHAKHRAERAYGELERAQEELIRTEKLAALGSLVAGVAHEINTPLGNTLTAASHLSDEARRLRESLAGGALRRSNLEAFLATEAEISRLMLANLERAAALVQSFKQVAVDQTSDDRRVFDLARYIDEVILSLRPRLKMLPHRVTVDCPADLRVDGYPGALFQVLTNLVMNALLHAFPAGEAGEITIRVTAPEADNDPITLEFRDNGAGMGREVRNRVFDPFFTTKRGAGGSGLGLHIVYNIVAVTMRGQIRVSSEPGQGTVFTIRFPAVMPLRDAGVAA